MTTLLLFCYCFARYLLCDYFWTLCSFLSDLISLSFTSNKSHFTPQNMVQQPLTILQLLSTPLKPPMLLLSMHGIQIISRASLCCCLEWMRVFELDLLDNIRSTQISFHAMLFYADRVAHTRKLLLFSRKLERKTVKPPS